MHKMLNVELLREIYSFAFFTRSSVMGTDGSFLESGAFVSIPECRRMEIQYSIILLHLVQVHSIFFPNVLETYRHENQCLPGPAGDSKILHKHQMGF